MRFFILGKLLEETQRFYSTEVYDKYLKQEILRSYFLGGNLDPSSWVSSLQRVIVEIERLWLGGMLHAQIQSRR